MVGAHLYTWVERGVVELSFSSKEKFETVQRPVLNYFLYLTSHLSSTVKRFEVQLIKMKTPFTSSVATIFFY